MFCQIQRHLKRRVSCNRYVDGVPFFFGAIPTKIPQNRFVIDEACLTHSLFEQRRDKIECVGLILKVS